MTKTISDNKDNIDLFIGKLTYFVGMKCYKTLSYIDDILTIDISHCYVVTEYHLLYDFMPIGTCYCSETNTYITGCLYGFYPETILNYKPNNYQFDIFDFL